MATRAGKQLAFQNGMLLTGNGSTVVIREGTIILAVLTGLCMRVTDPLLEKLFQPVTSTFTPHDA